ncbi:Flp family type IVb pilin [Variovorax sp. PAMC 28711]|uniref:Flp family type IVb pilin n=1 Tax=Variovorax sp. PAMC 28711 TaxID=1795631 RepID=UPI00078B920B|nr:hypothetical protein [Variovorax sp. PAMC 28711]AMM24621.1 hypothetical protein AX767_09860 [Variovorax sp. PAMC 28711]
MNRIRQSLQQTRQRGQGMVEYIIIVAVLALGSIAVYAAFGDMLRAQVSNATSVLGGEAKQSTGDMSTAKDNAKANTKKTLQNY